jgi:hypothetical protein
VTSVAGSAAGKSDISVAGNGIFADGVIADGLKLVYTTGNDAAVTVTYGAAPDATKTWVEADSGSFTLSSQTANKHCTVALVNKQTGLCVAGGDTTLVVGV